eukprot:2265638-Rhodomonas_salina.1
MPAMRWYPMLVLGTACPRVVSWYWLQYWAFVLRAQSVVQTMVPDGERGTRFPRGGAATLVLSPIGLCTCYAMSGTEIPYGGSGCMVWDV